MRAVPRGSAATPPPARCALLEEIVAACRERQQADGVGFRHYSWAVHATRQVLFHLGVLGKPSVNAATLLRQSFGDRMRDASPTLRPTFVAHLDRLIPTHPRGTVTSTDHLGGVEEVTEDLRLRRGDVEGVLKMPYGSPFVGGAVRAEHAHRRDAQASRRAVRARLRQPDRRAQGAGGAAPQPDGAAIGRAG